MNKLTKTKIDSKKEITREIDEKNNLVKKEETRYCIIEELNPSNYKIVSNSYMSLKELYNDYYVYGSIETNPEIINDNKAPLYKKKYGILKINRDDYLRVVPFAERIIVPPLYDEITAKNSNTVCVTLNQKCTFFDLNKEKQLTPVVLEVITSFDMEYPGFAQCFYNYKAGYLPRNIKPITDKNKINFLSLGEVEALVKYQENTDSFLESNKKYIELTGKSYTK